MKSLEEQAQEYVETQEKLEQAQNEVKEFNEKTQNSLKLIYMSIL